jgi:hypothetical protein
MRNDPIYTRPIALAYTGAPMAVMSGVSWGVALVMLGGLLTAAARLAPRIAVEPIQGRSSRYRLRLTRNGKPRRPSGRHARD